MATPDFSLKLFKWKSALRLIDLVLPLNEPNKYVASIPKNKGATLNFSLKYNPSFKSSHPEVFLEKGVLKICSKFTEEHPCRTAIIEIALRQGCFSCKFAIYFQNTFS